MKPLRFEWNERKNDSNRRKHGVSFEDAETAFADENALYLVDPDHSDEEERYLLLGLSASVRVLIVSHAYRSRESIIRIISARLANRRERAQYVQRWVK